MSKQVNIAHYIPELARSIPDHVALKYLVKGAYHSITFKEFHCLTNQYANGFKSQGVVKGARVLIMVKHTLDFYAVVFALFKVGAVPIVIDPGMRKRDLLKCIQQAEAFALVSIPLGHLISKIFAKYFVSVKKKFLVGHSLILQTTSLHNFKKNNLSNDVLERTNGSDLAAVLFTSGSTGVPKGVEYQHSMFDRQASTIKDIYDLKVGDIDLPCFPLFGLFSLVAGVTLVLPEMDPSKPANVNPKNIVEPIQKFQISNCFASPAVWNKVANYCVANSLKLDSLKTALAAGAPVQPWLVSKVMSLLPKGGDFHTPYGATESLPVSSIRGSRVLFETKALTEKGYGICVGKPVAGVKVKIIGIRDVVIKNLAEIDLLGENVIGEIIISSDMVTKKYFRSEEKTALAKIYDGDQVWHRIGDVGYLDCKGDLWFCGRKDHRVKVGLSTLFTVPCECIFNAHEKVFRTALVSYEKKGLVEPVLVIELETLYKNIDKYAKQKIVNELVMIGQKYQISKKINRFIFHKSLPVDVRHNAKINREALKVWVSNSKKFMTGAL